MSELKSQLGNRTNKPLRTFTVGEEQESFSDIENQSMPSVNRNIQQPMMPQRKNRLEALLGLRTESKEILINNVPITIRTLYTYEQKELDKFKGIDIAIQVCARAVLFINGDRIEDIIGGSDINDKIKFFEESHFVLVESIYLNYINFMKSINEKYYNTNNLSSEVEEDIKKA